MANNFVKIIKGLNLENLASAVSVKGDLAYNSSTDKLELYNGAVDPLVNEAKASTLTNKTMSGSSNTFSSIAYASLVLTNSVVNADIASGAAIAYSKLNLATSIVNADISASAAIVDTKLATISTAGKVSNSATTAVSTNTNSAIVTRDGSGNFSAGTISAALTGTASGNTTISGQTNHGVVVASTTNALGFTAAGTSGQALLSGGASADPAYGTLGATAGGTSQTTYTTGDLLYASATNTLSKLGVGSANQAITVLNGLPAWTTLNQGGINYISANPNAEVDTAGWATYADAAGAQPVDGTGGSPTETWTRSTSSPLRGSGSFLLTKDAANRQGEGASYAFTIDSADQGKVLQIAFDYTVASGTYATGDLTVYIYDLTNALITQPAGYQIQSITSGFPQKQIATFQTASNSTSYRLIIHTATTSASAYTLKVDNVAVGPQIVQYGAPVTDATSVTLTYANVGTVAAQSSYYIRRGDQLKVWGKVTTGTTAGSTFSITLPSGLSIDYTKVKSGETATVGKIYRYAGGTDYASTSGGPYPLFADGSATTTLFGAKADSGANLTKATGSALFNTGESFDFDFEVPITGWSSSVSMSNDTDTRVVAASYIGASVTVTGSDSILKYQTLKVDTHSAYSTSTGQYTVPVSGNYEIYGMAEFNFSSASANQACNISVYKNGVQFTSTTYRLGASMSDQNCSLQSLVSCVAGDTLDIRVSSSASSPNISNTNFTSLAIKRLSGPSAVAASESVNAKYTGSTSTVSGSAAVVKMSTKVFDSHAAYDTSTGLFTVPVSGVYSVTGSIYSTQASISAGQGTSAYIYKNGSVDMRNLIEAYSTTNNDMVLQVTGLVKCVAGDTIAIYASNSATTPAIQNNANMTYVCVSRVGN